MERKARERKTGRAHMEGVHITVHGLTGEELCVLAALRDPVKGARMWEARRKHYCGGSQSKQGK